MIPQLWHSTATNSPLNTIMKSYTLEQVLFKHIDILVDGYEKSRQIRLETVTVRVCVCMCIFIFESTQRTPRSVYRPIQKVLKEQLKPEREGLAPSHRLRPPLALACPAV